MPTDGSAALRAGLKSHRQPEEFMNFLLRLPVLALGLRCARSGFLDVLFKSASGAIGSSPWSKAAPTARQKNS